MKVTEDNIAEINLHLKEVAKELNLRPDDFPQLRIGDSDFDLDLDCADCVLDLGGFMERTMSIKTLSYDDCAVRCGRFTQFFINIEDYYDGKIMGCLYWHFLNDDIKVKVVLCPFLIGLRNIKERQYELGSISPFADFTALEIEYSEESKRLNKIEELELVQFQNTPFYRSLSQQFTNKDIESLAKMIYSGKTETEQSKEMLAHIRKLGFDFKTSSSYMYNNVKRLVNEHLSMELTHRLEVLDDVLKSKILYFPTYRRVESALGNFEEINKKLAEANPFYDRIDFEKIFQDEQMQFGMEDVYDSIHKITSEIYCKTMDGFSIIMGDMLGQLSKTNTGKNVDYNFDKKVIQIILDRLGDTIKEEDKNQIVSYANSGNLNNSNLNFLISKLAKLYDEQKKLDKALKVFKDTSNHYLSEKQFVYNESAIDLHIESSHNQERLDLECLSSGEKQIVSLFAKLFLDVDNTFIMLLDEPELSLSVLWQERLLPDILRSQKCNFMLAVTHSPFIYDNELEDSAQSISDFIKEKTNG